MKVKDIEKVTNHDVKAVEYFIKDEFDKLGLEQYKEFIHFELLASFGKLKYGVHTFLLSITYKTASINDHNFAIGFGRIVTHRISQRVELPH